MSHYKLTQEQKEQLSELIKEQVKNTFPEEWVPTDNEFKYAYEKAYKYSDGSTRGDVYRGLKTTYYSYPEIAIRKAIALMISYPEFGVIETGHFMVGTPYNMTSEEGQFYRSKLDNVYSPLCELIINKLDEYYDINESDKRKDFDKKQLIDHDYIEISNSIEYDNGEVEESRIGFIKIIIDFGSLGDFTLKFRKLPNEIKKLIEPELSNYIKKHNIRKA